MNTVMHPKKFRMKLCHAGENRRKKKKRKNEHGKFGSFSFQLQLVVAKMLIHVVQKWLYILKT